MKKILIVTDAWHPQVNGPVRTMETVGSELSKLGYDVHFLTPQQFRTVPLPGYGEIRVALPRFGAVARLIEEIDPDGIHLTTEGPLGWAARKYCLARKLPFSTSYHTQFPEYVRARAPVPVSFSYGVLRRFHRPAKWCLTSESVEKELRKRGFANTVVWNRGVDTKMFHPDMRVESGPQFDWPRPVFLYVGRLAVDKNIAEFLKLDLPGSKVIVGGGPARKELERQFPDAHFVGRVPDSDLGMFYASSDVFVFPSKTDTLGLVLYEALASGTPVAAYPVMGPLDVIGDAPVGALRDDLRTACLDALEIPRADCRAFAEKFTWKASAEQFVAHLPWIEKG